MSLDREAIFTAIFTRLQAIPGVVTCSRKWRPWDQLGEAEQPAIFFVMGNESAKADRQLPTVWTLRPTIYIYARNDADPSAPGGIVLHSLLQAVEACFDRTATEQNLANVKFTPNAYGTTLGGLVSACYINGEIETDEGLMQNQCVAIIPLEIVTTA